MQRFEHMLRESADCWERMSSWAEVMATVRCAAVRQVSHPEGGAQPQEDLVVAGLGGAAKARGFERSREL